MAGLDRVRIYECWAHYRSGGTIAKAGAAEAGHTCEALPVKNIKSGVAFITGGASGIGFGIAQALGNHGMKIALADVNENALERAAAALGATGATVLPVTLDVRDRSAWETELDRTERELGPLQVLCSNAGVAGSHLPIEETDWSGWQWTIDVNLHGTFHALNNALPRMRRHGRDSHVVCTSSLGAFLVNAGNGAYCAAKAAVVAVSEAVRREVAGSNIGVSVLCPGLVATQLLDNVKELAPAHVRLGSHSEETAIALKAGQDAAAVGELVLRGILEDRFWVFTHPELRDLLENRANEMRAAM
jgi:NADP-dependent 3-hydroxy acid dehydrogenase YdfG